MQIVSCEQGHPDRAPFPTEPYLLSFIWVFVYCSYCSSDVCRTPRDGWQRSLPGSECIPRPVMVV